MIGASLMVVLVVTASGAGSAGTATILRAETIAGVSGPYVGATNPIRGVNGGGLPWDIAEGKVVLATTTDDSKIEATVSLPDPCFAPIVFVTSPTGSWFAVTGA